MTKASLALLTAALLAAVLALLALTGCSSAPEEEPKAAPDATAPAATPADESAAESAATPTDEEQPDPVDVNVVALKGPTAMGMVKLMSDVDAGDVTSNDYHFSIAANVDEVPPLIAKGEVDIAAVPANLASVLYNNTEGSVEVLAINTLGVLYLVENGEASGSLEQLKGRTIYASGKGATPEYALNYILTQNGIDPASDVTIEWLPEHAACVTSLVADPTGIALLPQPFVTSAQTQSPELHVTFDLTEEWEKLGGDSTLVTGVVVARKDFIEQEPQAIADFLEKYEASVRFVNANNDEAAALVGAYDIVPEAVAQKALPECNIVYLAGDEMHGKLSGYLQTLYDQNPASVGGTLPPDEFYYRG
jgi:NitT/TauT family transport system substrate-binding protein